MPSSVRAIPAGRCALVWIGSMDTLESNVLRTCDTPVATRRAAVGWRAVLRLLALVSATLFGILILGTALLLPMAESGSSNPSLWVSAAIVAGMVLAFLGSAFAYRRLGRKLDGNPS